ncbi:MAG: type II toxin-antitoxin system ParD family antitoxin [Sphingomonadales bacterium]|nr:type II toxin-antitoxin system ParD family antitoxin [Sphingomonadales bacterium]
MTDLSFSLPATLQSWIEEQIAHGNYADAGDYLRDLIRRDRAEARDIVRVRSLIEEGEASGYLDAEPETIIEDIIAQRRALRG